MEIAEHQDQRRSARQIAQAYRPTIGIDEPSLQRQNLTGSLVVRVERRIGRGRGSAPPGEDAEDER